MRRAPGNPRKNFLPRLRIFPSAGSGTVENKSRKNRQHKQVAYFPGNALSEAGGATHAGRAACDHCCSERHYR